MAHPRLTEAATKFSPPPPPPICARAATGRSMIAICAATVVATAACSGAGGGRGATQSSPADVALASAPSALPFPDAIILPSFHSKRFELSLPLPDGKAWRIDDHSHVELVASHAPTRSKLVVYVFADPELMSRQSCEEKARARGLVPNVDMRTVEDHVAIGPETYDTRLWVTIAAPKGGGRAAFGARFCLWRFSTKVPIFPLLE